jgi:hypothetical protein
MAQTVDLSAQTQERPGEEGIARVDFPEGAPGGPQRTRAARLVLSGGSYEEPPEPGRVRFFYILEGEATLSSGLAGEMVKKGSTVFLAEGEGLLLTRLSETPLVFLRFAFRDA